MQRQTEQDEKIILTPEERAVFERSMKRGVYYVLYKRGLLTEWQLNDLLNRAECKHG